MIRSFLAFLMALALPAMAMADGPTTRPVKVGVMTFEVLGNSGQEWMGQALQDGLAMGLQKAPGISAIIVPGLAPADTTAAMAAANPVDADAVLFGIIQVLDDQIRVGGQIVSAKTGQTIGILQTDGTARGLFDIEDLLSARAGRILMPANRAAVSKAAPVTFEIVGPTVATRGAQYFDGDISAVIGRPQRFRDDYDRYYYQSADTSNWAAICGMPFGGGFGCGIACGGGNPALLSVAAPVRGW